MEIILREKALEISPPASYAARFDLVSSRSTNAVRCMAGCLVACCPVLPAKQRAGLLTLLQRGDIGTYGGACVDALHSSGLTIEEIITAGLPCWAACSEHLYTEEELKASEVFTAAPAGGSTGRFSNSATPGASLPHGGEGSPTTSV